MTFQFQENGSPSPPPPPRTYPRTLKYASQVNVSVAFVLLLTPFTMGVTVPIVITVTSSNLSLFPAGVLCLCFGGRRRGEQRKRWEDNIREWTGLEFGKSQRAVENREKWRKLVAKSSVVLKRPSRLTDWWWWWWWTSLGGIVWNDSLATTRLMFPFSFWYMYTLFQHRAPKLQRTGAFACRLVYFRYCIVTGIRLFQHRNMKLQCMLVCMFV